MKQNIILFFAVCITLFSCNKKSLPINTIGAPIFYFDGKINNVSKLFEAGNDSLYMYTNTFTNATNGKTLQGWFANQANKNSEPNLLFELINYKPNGTGNIAAEILNMQNFYSFSLDTSVTIDTSEEITFIPKDSTQTNATYLWLFDDGTSSTQKSPKKTFATQAQHTVTFIYNAGQNCGADTISNTINTNLNSTCRAQFIATNTSTLDSIRVLATTSFTSSKTLKWVWGIGDTTVNMLDDSSSHTFLDSLNHTILLIASDNGCTVNFKSKISPIGMNNCLASYTYTTNNIYVTTNGTNRKNTFVITWKNAGATYKSYKTNSTANQNNALILKVNNTSMYNTNTVSINGVSNCWLYNTANNNDSIQIQSTKLNFALGF